MRWRSIAWLVFGLSFLVSAYFFQGGGWNQDSRHAMVRAMAEEGRIEITTFHTITGDKSKIGDKYYSDKAPGSALFAYPAVALANQVALARGRSLASSETRLDMLYIAGLFASALPAALLGFLLVFAARRIGASKSGAFFAAISATLGTQLFPYSGLFWGHNLAASSMWLAAVAALMLQQEERRSTEIWLGLAVGLGAGWSTVTEYPSGIVAVLLTLFVAISLWKRPASRIRVGVPLIVAAGFCASILMYYNHLAFGSPFKIGYQAQANFESIEALIEWPHLDRLRMTMFGRFRGFFWLSPVFVFAPFGLHLMWQKRQLRLFASLSFVVIAFYFLLNAAFRGWWGGWCYGPRNITVAIPFLALPLSLLWTRANHIGKSMLALISGYGFTIALMAATSAGQPPDSYRRPLAQLWGPRFWGEDFMHFGGAWNLGEKLFSLEGFASLIPLAILTFLFVAMLFSAELLQRKREDLKQS